MSDKEFVWTCGVCRLRNTSVMPAGASREKTVAVRCRACEREQNVTPVLVLTSHGPGLSVIAGPL